GAGSRLPSVLSPAAYGVGCVRASRPRYRHGMGEGHRYVYTDKQMPSIHGAMAAVSKEIRARADEHGIDHIVLELVDLRASQLNGCAFCLHLHTHLALRDGESPQRI